MTTRAKIITTVLLLVGLAGVGVTDYWLAGRDYAAELIAQQPTNGDTTTGGVAKAQEADVQSVITQLGLTLSPSDDLTFLAQVAKDQKVESYTLMKDGDRAGSISWIDGDSKQAFISLKEALLSAFSDQVSDLSDKTLQEENRPTRNVLTFRDPALSEETLTFIRIRERLYEIHTAQNKQDAVNAAIEGITAR